MKKKTHLSSSDYRALVRLMEVCDHETDNDGQIIIYTDHAFDENDAIVSLGLSSDGDEE